MRRGDGAVPTLCRREPGRGQDRSLVHPVAARFDHVGHNVVTLLDQLDTGQSARAAIQRLRTEVFDLGEQRLIVGGEWIDTVAAEYLYPAPGCLRLERIGEAHSVGAGVVDDE